MGQGPNTRSDSDNSMVPEAVHYTFSLFWYITRTWLFLRGDRICWARRLNSGERVNLWQVLNKSSSPLATIMVVLDSLVLQTVNSREFSDWWLVPVWGLLGSLAAWTCLLCWVLLWPLLPVFKTVWTQIGRTRKINSSDLESFIASRSSPAPCHCD